jgi:hypothetical protein
VLAGLLWWDRGPDWSAPSTVGEGARSHPAVKPKADQAETRSEFANGDAKLVNPLGNLELDQLHDTIRRPLFEEGRRPVEAPVPPAPAAPAPPPRRTADPKALTLMGILTSEGRAIALLTRNRTGQNVRAEEGDTVDGWTIERIEARHVVLRHGDTKIALQIFRKR